jgi:hypothetical protein
MTFRAPLRVTDERGTVLFEVAACEGHPVLTVRNAAGAVAFRVSAGPRHAAVEVTDGEGRPGVEILVNVHEGGSVGIWREGDPRPFWLGPER